MHPIFLEGLDYTRKHPHPYACAFFGELSYRIQMRGASNFSATDNQQFQGLITAMNRERSDFSKRQP